MTTAWITKFKKLSPKKGYTAAYIQLPWNKYENLIGRAVEIEEVEGGFFIKLNGDKFKPSTESDVEKRLQEIERKIEQLLKGSGLEEIRTPDLRHVKATS
jgi:hypothetical protein